MLTAGQVLVFFLDDMTIHGLKFRVHHMFFDVVCWPSASFLFGLQAYVRLTFCKQGWVVHKLVDTNPGLKKLTES